MVSTGLPDKIKSIEDKFSDLAGSLLSHLKSRKICVEKLTSWISTLPRSVNVYVFPLSENLKEKISSSYTLDSLFAILNMEIWNILDFRLLEYFIKKSGADELAEGMKKYISELEKFKKEILVIDFIECWEGHNRTFPEYDELTIKFNKQSLTLAKLDKFHRTLVRKCIPSMLNYSGWICYKHFKSACFEVTWMLPIQLAMLVKRNIPTMCKVLESFKVQQVAVAGTSVYNPHKYFYKGIKLDYFQ